MEKRNFIKRFRVALKWIVKISTIIVELSDYFKNIWKKNKTN